MTVGNATEGVVRSGPFYVRLQNLPLNATQKHIRDFFSDITILDGGISIHRNFSFVVFDNVKDAAAALSKNNKLYDGKNVHISNALLKDVQRTRATEARKNLVFDSQEHMAILKPKKRIRPTKVKDCSTVVASKRFCPDEIEIPAKNQVTSLMGMKMAELKLNNETHIENGLRLHDDKINKAESQANLLVESIPEHKLCSQDEVHNPNASTLLLRNNIGKTESDLKDEKNVENVSGSCFLKKFSSEKNESRHLEENAFVKGKMKKFLDEKAPNNKDEISFMDENHSAKPKREEKVTGQSTCSAFPKKVRDVTNKLITKRTIKPTSVLTMNLFKMANEGTVF